MKIHLAALAGLAVGFALPAFAQQKEIDPQIKQAVEAHNKAYDTAFNKNDATAIAALFAPDVIEVGPDGVQSGKEAVQARYAKLFEKWHPTDHLNTIISVVPVGDEIALINKWTVDTYAGYVTIIMEKQGDQWLDHIATFNITPPPAAPTTK